MTGFGTLILNCIQISPVESPVFFMLPPPSPETTSFSDLVPCTWLPVSRDEVTLPQEALEVKEHGSELHDSKSSLPKT